MEVGLWNYHSQRAYRHFIRTLVDTQRANGQLPGIAPTGGWGFNWGNLPGCDALLMGGPYQLLRYTGDDGAIREHYDAMRRYFDYLIQMEEDGRIGYGLGDWIHPDQFRAAPVELCDTAFYHFFAKRMVFYAGYLGRDADVKGYTELCQRIFDGFNRVYNQGDGNYGSGNCTSLSLAAYYGLSTDPARTAELLVQEVRRCGHRADFGTLGALTVPRVLAEHGYIDDVFLLFTQTEFPGWGNMLVRGATTLWEQWNGCGSRNHVFLGDPAACLYEYFAGIQPLIETPGFAHFRVKPGFASKINHIEAEHQSPRGLVRSRWHRVNGKIRCEIDIPDGSTADIVLPGRTISAARGKQVLEY